MLAKENINLENAFITYYCFINDTEIYALSKVISCKYGLCNAEIKDYYIQNVNIPKCESAYIDLTEVDYTIIPTELIYNSMPEWFL